MYSFESTTNSQKHSRNCRKLNYYDEVMQVNVVDTGCYILGINSTVDTYGYIYKNNYNSSRPSENLLSHNDYESGGGQFRFASYLEANTKYILVVTTYSRNATEKFSIVVSGSKSVTVNRTSEYL